MKKFLIGLGFIGVIFASSHLIKNMGSEEVLQEEIPTIHSTNPNESESSPSSIKSLPVNDSSANENDSKVITSRSSTTLSNSLMADGDLSQRSTIQFIGLKPKHSEQAVLTQEKVENYKILFPTVGTGHFRENDFGVVEEDVPGILQYLKQHLAPSAGDAVITSDKREMSAFFEAVNGLDFRGNLLDSNEKSAYSFKIGFSQNGQDSVHIFKGPQNLENRTIPLVDEGIWRFDLEKDGIFLFQNRCPWNREFQFEKKQFYYFKKLQKLGANVYCRKQEESDSQWSLIGFIVASPVN